MKKIEEILWTDPQCAKLHGRCRSCGTQIYTPGGKCRRCRRDAA